MWTVRLVNLESIEKILKKMAKQYGVTPAEMREDISIMIEAVMLSDDPKITHMWSQIPHSGKWPTVDEFICFYANSTLAKSHTYTDY